MTTYDFETGTVGTAATANTLASGVSAGTGNTMTVATDQRYSGSRSLKIVSGTTAVSVLDYRSTGNASQGTGTGYGTASDLSSGMTVFFYPSGGFDSSATGASAITLIRQWYGGTTTTEGAANGRIIAADAATGLTSSGTLITQTNTPLAAGDKLVFTAVGAATNITVGTTYYVVTKTASTFGVATTVGGTALTLGTATGIAYQQTIRFNNNAVTATLGIHGNMVPLQGHWVGIRHQISCGASAAGGQVLFRVYDLGTLAAPLYPDVNTFVTEVSSPAVTGSGGTATGGIDLGGTGGTLNVVTRFRIGIGTIQAAARTTWWDYLDETPGSLQWVAGPPTMVVGAGDAASTATITGTGRLGVVGTGTVAATATITGAGAVTAGTSGDGTSSTTATILGDGAAAASGSGTTTTTATIAGAGTVTAGISGAGTATTTATILGAGNVATSSAGTRPTTATISGAGSTGTAGTGTRPVTATIVGAGNVSTANTGARTTVATITGSGQVTIPATGTFVVTAAITGAGTVTAGVSSGGTRPVTATIVGAGQVSTTGSGTRPSTVTITGAGQVATTSSGQAPTVAVITGTGLVSVTAAGGVVTVATIDGAGAVSTSAPGDLAVTAVITGGGTVTATHQRDITVTIVGPYHYPVGIVGPYVESLNVAGPYHYPLPILGPLESTA